MAGELNIKLESFEGPIELLYHLIEKNEIDIYDIPIAQLTDQYIEYINQFPKDMELMSNFLLMASSLLEIKSKMLLPSQKKEDGQPEEDPREELVRKLLEYKKFKEISDYFKVKSDESHVHIFKEPEKEVLNLFREHKRDIDEVLEGITAESLFQVFKDVLMRKEKKIDKIRSSFNSVKKDIFTIDEKIDSIKTYLQNNKSLKFKSMFSEEPTKIEVIVTFLALLELIKSKTVRISQENPFDDIVINSY